MESEALVKDEIRLHYSGFIVFASKLLSVVSGLAFQLMVARGTTELEYDLFFNLRDILAYFTLLATALPFWTMRFVARNKEGAVSTGIFANLAISTLAAAIYLPSVPFLTSVLGVRQEYLLLYFIVAIQIFELYTINALQACLQAKTPHAIGYGLLIAEVCKVGLGYLLIVEFRQPLMGALVSLIFAYCLQMAYYIRLLRIELRQHLRTDYIKEWLKGSLANIYNIVGNQMANFVFILLFAYGGEGARGRYGLAAQVASIVAYSSFLSFALYPKLLAARKKEDITASLKMVLLFAIPMATGAIALSDSYTVIMKSVYKDASIVLAVLAIDALVMTISGFFSSVLFGLERVDEAAGISFRTLVKSRLFIAFSLPYIHSLLTLPTTFYLLTNYAQNQPLQAAISVSTLNLLARSAMFVVLYSVVRRMIEINIPWKSIAKNVFAAAVMAIVLLLIPHPTKIHLTIAATAMGGVIYLGLSAAIDKETRMLVNSVLQEIRSRFMNRKP